MEDYNPKLSKGYKPTHGLSKYKILIPAVALVAAGLGAIGGVTLSNRNHNNKTQLEATVEAAASNLPLNQPTSEPVKWVYDKEAKYLRGGYIVKKGDTFETIAAGDLGLLKYLKARYDDFDLKILLKPGTELQIPVKSTLRDEKGIIGETIEDFLYGVKYEKGG